jgi:hypothetical protein
VPRGNLINFTGALYIESLVRALVVKYMNESIELGLLLKEVSLLGPQRGRRRYDINQA